MTFMSVINKNFQFLSQTTKQEKMLLIEWPNINNPKVQYILYLANF